MQKYHISKVKHRYQINRYCKLLNKQKRILGSWERDFDKILLTHCKYRSLIWIYTWTRWATCWQPAQFSRVRILPSNRTRVDGSCLLTNRTRTQSDGPEPLLTLTILLSLLFSLCSTLFRIFQRLCIMITSCSCLALTRLAGLSLSA